MARLYKKWWLIGLFSLVALWGCASQYRITNLIDARALQQQPDDKTYWLMPGDSTLSSSSLAYMGYARYIETMLQQRGYTRASSEAQANVVILFSYSISGPRTKLYSQADPIWLPNQAFYNDDCFNCFSMPIYQENIYSKDVYSMKLQLDAYVAQPYFQQKKMQPLWSVHDSVITNSSDLRAIFPYMVAATGAYIERDSGQQVTLSIPQNDPTVLQLINAQQPAVPQ